MKNILDIVNEIKSSADKQIYVFGRGPTEQVVKEFSFRLQLLGYNTLSTEDPAIMVTLIKIHYGYAHLGCAWRTLCELRKWYQKV